MEAFVAGGLALPFVLFGLLCWVRRARFRSLATALGGAHAGAWPLSVGRIRGQDFEIAVEKVGKTYRTLVRLAARTPGTFVLRPEFFEGFPAWSFARVPGRRSERVFLWEISLPSFVEPDEAQRKLLLGWLGHARRTNLAAALRNAKVREILVEDGSVSTSLRGIVTNLGRVRGTLEALRLLAA